ncbi:MAG: hypothetical protein QOI12_4550 [Alphaproteobacteria bacterium]|jgi:hypothetical protein|nr:hypothetical protein [Alphaproteobacteria bacterium]
MKPTLACAGVALIAMTAAADARVTRLEISRQEPFAAGQAFGNSGAYEKIAGRFHGELDPAHPLNAAIVDLDKAPRNAKGMVEYSADFYILKPVDLTKGNGAIFYEANNRGNKASLGRFNNAPRGNDPSTAADAGNGFLMRQGFTLVWNGWMPGLPAENNVMRIEIPSATGSAIEQTVWDELLFNDTKTVRARLTFRASSTAKTEAKLLVRERNSEEPTTVAPEQWEFVDARTIRLLPEGTPFRIGAIYQLLYRSATSPVSGIGFAATRDFNAFLRYAKTDEAGTPNPLAVQGSPAITRALAHGNSQTGRYLRDLIYSGFNEDEAGRIVFDGVLPNVAAGRIFLNYRFAQPNRIIPAGHGFMYFPGATFPYAYETQTDPFTGKSDGTLARCTARGNCPKLIHTNSSTEYWQGGQSLITTDALGKSDSTPPDSVRIYHFSGTQHAGVETSMPAGVCVMPTNRTDYRPFLRAALANLDRWVKDGTPPPASRYPRIADGTLVETITLPAIPGVTPAKGPATRPRIDYGPDFDKGIIGKALPVVLKDAYRVLVPKVDADGNELGGLRSPEVAVPTGTGAGWNVRAPESGGAGELCYLEGGFVPFAKTRAEREAKNDPRPSLEERYKDGADYAERVRQAAEALQRDGYILPEDVKRIADKAAALTW